MGDQVLENIGHEQKVHPEWLYEKINRLNPAFFETALLGSSTLGKPIYAVKKRREGGIRVLLWSQMHGDESTATRAFILLWQRLESERPDWLEKLSIRFIPMLNPDGAALWQRENAAGIDINRDALSQDSPEAKLLANALLEFKPDYAFNLHDQQIYYGIDSPPRPATISLMAPPVDNAESWPEHRQKAASLCAEVKNYLELTRGLSPGRWADPYEPRAFGEFAQSLGSSTILIEAGGLKNDPEKQKLCIIYADLLFAMLKSIATESYTRFPYTEYAKIPANKLTIFDYILRNVTIILGNQHQKADIGIRNRRSFVNGEWALKSTIDEIGDLGYAAGLHEFDAMGLEAYLIPDQAEIPEFYDTSSDKLPGNPYWKPGADARIILLENNQMKALYLEGTLTAY